jgi:hypothetical protein
VPVGAHIAGATHAPPWHTLPLQQSALAVHGLLATLADVHTEPIAPIALQVPEQQGTVLLHALPAAAHIGGGVVCTTHAPFWHTLPLQQSEAAMHGLLATHVAGHTPAALQEPEQQGTVLLHMPPAAAHMVCCATQAPLWQMALQQSEFAAHIAPFAEQVGSAWKFAPTDAWPLGTRVRVTLTTDVLDTVALTGALVHVGTDIALTPEHAVAYAAPVKVTAPVGKPPSVV